MIMPFRLTVLSRFRMIHHANEVWTMSRGYGGQRRQRLWRLWHEVARNASKVWHQYLQIMIRLRGLRAVQPLIQCVHTSAQCESELASGAQTALLILLCGTPAEMCAGVCGCCEQCALECCMLHCVWGVWWLEKCFVHGHLTTK